MSDVEKLSTGVPGLDVLTYGGVPKGRATLICGKSGTAKSVSSLQLACNFAKNGTRTLLIAVEDEPDDLLTTGDALGFCLSEHVHKKLIRIADLTPPMDGPTVISGDYDITGLIHRVEKLAKDFNAEAIVLDSATALFSPRPPEVQLRSLFFQLVHAFRRLGLTAVITAEAPQDYGPLTTLGVEDYVCDLVIILRNLVDEGRRRRSVEIHKYRRSAHFKGEYPCTITRNGLTVFPLDAKEHPFVDETQRFSSGVQGLDEMTHGGWLRDSIVLVRGPSGSGKTTLSGMYARAGALRGERVVYWGFEETRAILLRNFNSLGMPLEPFEREGKLRVMCRYPEATSPEDLLVDLRAGLEEFKPSLIVLDSISSIQHSTSPSGFRQFMVGLASLLREHGRSALLTQTTPLDRQSDTAAPYLSTICDGILLVEYSTREVELERSLRVLKMRGSAHASDKRRLAIGPGGLKLEPLAPTPRTGT
ncbi:MAG: circadian clock protein KaiC [Myxococcaceae bacterium]